MGLYDLFRRKFERLQTIPLGTAGMGTTHNIDPKQCTVVQRSLERVLFVYLFVWSTLQKE